MGCAGEGLPFLHYGLGDLSGVAIRSSALGRERRSRAGVRRERSWHSQCEGSGVGSGWRSGGGGRGRGMELGRPQVAAVWQHLASSRLSPALPLDQGGPWAIRVWKAPDPARHSLISMYSGVRPANGSSVKSTSYRCFRFTCSSEGLWRLSLSERMSFFIFLKETPRPQAGRPGWGVRGRGSGPQAGSPAL